MPVPALVMRNAEYVGAMALSQVEAPQRKDASARSLGLEKRS
jgi:hypothetical protein